MSKAPARTRLVGFDETRIAEEIFATANCAVIQARGFRILDAARVMYARNAVPLRMIGSWKLINENLRSRWRNEPHIANESPQTEKEGVEVEVEAVTVLSAFAQDPER